MPTRLFAICATLLLGGPALAQEVARPGGTQMLQIITWSANRDLSEKHLNLHGAFLNAIKLTLGEEEF